MQSYKTTSNKHGDCFAINESSGRAFNKGFEARLSIFCDPPRIVGGETKYPIAGTEHVMFESYLLRKKVMIKYMVDYFFVFGRTTH